jgi:hypothetical protein
MSAKGVVLTDKKSIKNFPREWLGPGDMDQIIKQVYANSKYPMDVNMHKLPYVSHIVEGVRLKGTIHQQDTSIRTRALNDLRNFVQGNVDYLHHITFEGARNWMDVMQRFQC